MTEPGASPADTRLAVRGASRDGGSRAPSRSRSAFPDAWHETGRDRFFAALAMLACGNGLAASIADCVSMLGWSEALLGTFSVSAIVWVACFAAIALLIRKGDGESITRADLGVGIVVLLLAVVPLGKLSWLALTGLSLHLLQSSPDSTRRRAGLILLTVTGPMLWGPLLLGTFGRPIVRIDALIVSHLIGTEAYGNVVKFVGAGTGNFQISPGCSSLQGMSLAIVAWMTISQSAGRTWSRKDLVWCGLAGLAVIAANNVRLSAIGLFPSQFATIERSRRRRQSRCEFQGWLRLTGRCFGLPFMRGLHEWTQFTIAWLVEIAKADRRGSAHAS